MSNSTGIVVDILKGLIGSIPSPRYRMTVNALAVALLMVLAPLVVTQAAAANPTTHESINSDPGIGDRYGAGESTSNESQDESSPECITADRLDGAYPTWINIKCTALRDRMGGQADSARLSFEMQRGWAYIVHIDVPDDAQPTDVLQSNKTFVRAGWAVNVLPAFPSEVRPQDDAVTVYSIVGGNPSPAGGGVTTPVLEWGMEYREEFGFTEEHGRYDGQVTLLPPMQKETRIVIEPGVYDVEAYAYQPKEVSDELLHPADLPPAGTTSYLVSRAAAITDYRESDLQFQIAGCRADYNPIERLNDIDEEKLEAISDFFAQLRQFNAQHTSAAADAGIAFGSLILPQSKYSPTLFRNSKYLRTPAQSLLELVTMPSPSAAVKELKRALEQAVDLEESVERFDEIERQRMDVKDEMLRCYGGPYDEGVGSWAPDGYESLDLADNNEAKRADGDTRKDQSGG